MTIQFQLDAATRVLRSAGIPDAGNEAMLLLAHAAGRDRGWLRAHAEEEAPEAFDALLARRVAREPFAYIVGWAPFCGLRLNVTPDVLIPRPETETFVEEIIKRCTVVPATILDVGTGSGAIALALAAAFPHAQVRATDVSPAALAVARSNDPAGRVAFMEADLLSGIDGTVDLLVANLPYLTTDEMRLLPAELTHEPALALAAGADGNVLVRKLLGQAPRVLAPGGRIALELHPSNIAETVAHAKARFPGADVAAFGDLAGVERFVCVEVLT